MSNEQAPSFFLSLRERHAGLNPNQYMHRGSRAWDPNELNVLVKRPDSSDAVLHKNNSV